MRILITGGNGYVGRRLTRHLYQEHDVAVIDNLRYGTLRFDEAELDRFDLHRVDITDGEAVQRAVDEIAPEVVIHLAAIHFIPECEQQPDEAVAINVMGTLNVLRACAPGTRFVTASTAAVYAPDDAPHHETRSTIGPMDIYGLTKLHAEQYARYWARRGNLDVRIVRLFNVIGPGETNPHVLPAILAQTLDGNRTVRLGNCHPKRDYIHVGDAAAGFAAVALTPLPENGHDAQKGHVDVVNLGTGQGYSVYELIDILSEVVGEPITIDVDQARVRKSDRPFLRADITRIGAVYGWAPTHSLEDSLRDLWANPDIPEELLARS